MSHQSLSFGLLPYFLEAEVVVNCNQPTTSQKRRMIDRGHIRHRSTHTIDDVVDRGNSRLSQPDRNHMVHVNARSSWRADGVLELDW